eukprot:1109704-Amphidinium_carterae.1
MERHWRGRGRNRRADGPAEPMCLEGTLATRPHSGICAKADIHSQGEDNPLIGLVEACRAQTPTPCGFCNACEHIQRI